MKTLFVLLDGAEDHPLPALHGLKPLDVAHMPYLKNKTPYKYCTEGRSYTHKFLTEFFTGLPPRTSRGAFEALGLDMDMTAGRVAYRLSPAMIDDDSINWAYCIEERVSDLMDIVEENMPIINHMLPDINFFLKGRAVITLESEIIMNLPGPPVSAQMVPVDGCLGDFVKLVAHAMDGLTLFPWGGGKLEQENELIEGITPLTVVSNSPTALGISKALGEKAIRVNDLSERFPVALDHLSHSNVLLHVDETDEYSHQHRSDLKVETLELTDRLMEQYFPNVGKLVFLVDHGTSCITGEHLPVTVPLWSNYEINQSPGSFIPLCKLLRQLIRPM